MTYDYRSKKTVIVVSSSLSNGVAANVIGHLALAIGSNIDKNDMGRVFLKDASGMEHRGISKYPVIVTTVKPARIRRLVVDARAVPEILLIDYPEEMLATGHDDELASALAGRAEGEMVYLGAAIHGYTDSVNTLSGKFTLWKGSATEGS